MRIALNLLYLIPTEVCGTETYAKGLCDGLAQCGGDNEFYVYVNESARHWPLPDSDRFHRTVCGVSGIRRIARYLYEEIVLPRLLARDRIDVVLSLGNVSPLFAPCGSVVTISDLYFKHFAKDMSFLRWAALSVFITSSARRCDGIIAVSEFAKREMCREYPWAAKKITVTHLATGISLASQESQGHRAALQMPSRYFVAFSSESPHKNLKRLIEAYMDLRARKAVAHELVILGKQARKSLPVEGVTYTGYLPDDAVQSILEGASFMMFPSLYEGFGLPLLEAMALGVPVACSTAGSLPEVAGNAALFFSPTSIPEIRDALARMSGEAELRESLKIKGYENLKRFSWQATAMQTQHALKLALKPRSGRHANHPE
ncbi:MAG: glycosyltransferase family 1 protein [Terracidiphilus sp.]